MTSSSSSINTRLDSPSYTAGPSSIDVMNHKLRFDKVFIALRLMNCCAMTSVKSQELVKFGPATCIPIRTRWKLSVRASKEESGTIGG